MRIKDKGGWGKAIGKNTRQSRKEDKENGTKIEGVMKDTTANSDHLTAHIFTTSSGFMT